MTRIERIRHALDSVFAGASIELEDESHLHAGHAGARDGRGHYSVRIVSADFAGKPPLVRHRMVYAAMGDLMETDVHALRIQALTPQEHETAA